MTRHKRHSLLFNHVLACQRRSLAWPKIDWINGKKILGSRRRRRHCTETKPSPKQGKPPSKRILSACKHSLPRMMSQRHQVHNQNKSNIIKHNFAQCSQCIMKGHENKCTVIEIVCLRGGLWSCQITLWHQVTHTLHPSGWTAPATGLETEALFSAGQIAKRFSIWHACPSSIFYLHFLGRSAQYV